MGLSSDLGWVGKQVLWVCLVGLCAVASLRHRCGAADSHPEGEPSAGSVAPVCLGAALVVGLVVELVLLLPMGLRHLPCLLLLLLPLPGAYLLLAPCSIRAFGGSVASLPTVGGLPSSRLRDCIPGRQTPSHTGSCQMLSSRWRHSSSQRARGPSRSQRSRCSSSVRAPKSGHRWPGWVQNSSQLQLAWTLAMSSPSVGSPKWSGAPLLVARKYSMSSRIPRCCQLVLASTSALQSSHASTHSGPRMSRSICSSAFHL